MTTNQHDSPHPQHSHSSPQEVDIGLGLTMETDEVVLPGILLCFASANIGPGTFKVAGITYFGLDQVGTE